MTHFEDGHARLGITAGERAGLGAGSGRQSQRPVGGVGRVAEDVVCEAAVSELGGGFIAELVDR